MSWAVIRAIQKEHPDLRLILPFGLNLQVGHVVTVSKKDGTLTIEGDCFSLLGEKPPTVSPPETSFDISSQCGGEIKIIGRAAGTAPSAFPSAPSAKGGFDITFTSANSVVLAVVGRCLTASTDVGRFRHAILDAYDRGIWTANHALITSVATVEKMTLLASKSSDTKVALSVSGSVASDTPTAIDLTTDAALLAINKAITQAITAKRGPAFCKGLRVHESWFTDPEIRVLDAAKPDQTDEQDFWEDFDAAFSRG
jgi:hypothetical protein